MYLYWYMQLLVKALLGNYFSVFVFLIFISWKYTLPKSLEKVWEKGKTGCNSDFYFIIAFRMKVRDENEDRESFVMIGKIFISLENSSLQKWSSVLFCFFGVLFLFCCCFLADTSQDILLYCQLSNKSGRKHMGSGVSQDCAPWLVLPLWQSPALTACLKSLHKGEGSDIMLCKCKWKLPLFDSLVPEDFVNRDCRCNSH